MPPATPNWQWRNPDSPPDTQKMPILRHLSIPDAHVELDDQRRHLEFERSRLGAERGRRGAISPLTIEGNGELNGHTDWFGSRQILWPRPATRPVSFFLHASVPAAPSSRDTVSPEALRFQRPRCVFRGGGSRPQRSLFSDGRYAGQHRQVQALGQDAAPRRLHPVRRSHGRRRDKATSAAMSP